VRSRLPPIRRPTGWTALAVACALALVGVALSGTPRVATVSVTGAHHLNAAAVKAATGLLGRPVFTTGTADARAALLQLPAVREARVQISLLDAAHVEVIEREAIGRWTIAGADWLVDADGVVFRSSDPQSAPQLRAFDDRDATKACAAAGGGRCVDPAVVAGAFRLARITPGELRADATKPEVRVDPTQGLVVRTGAGWEIRFGTPDELERKLSNARKLLSDNPTRRLDYVDVRSPDRIVFSPQ
jgi:cell division septal protein FtsQ